MPTPYPRVTVDGGVENADPTGVSRWSHTVTAIAFGGGAVAFFVCLVMFGVLTHAHYRAMGKTAEATHELGLISTRAVEAYERGRTEPRGPSLCTSAPSPVPKNLDAVRGRFYQTVPREWNEGDPDQGFRCLGHEMIEPQFYQYDYGSTAPQGRFTATARGDLDGDGETSEISQSGEVDAAKRTVVLASKLRKTAPDE
jgi:hypothetical protein